MGGKSIFYKLGNFVSEASDRKFYNYKDLEEIQFYTSIPWIGVHWVKVEDSIALQVGSTSGFEKAWLRILF